MKSWYVRKRYFKTNNMGFCFFKIKINLFRSKSLLFFFIANKYLVNILASITLIFLWPNFIICYNHRVNSYVLVIICNFSFNIFELLSIIFMNHCRSKLLTNQLFACLCIFHGYSIFFCIFQQIVICIAYWSKNKLN